MSVLQKMFDRLREHSIPHVVMSSVDGFPHTALDAPVEILIDRGEQDLAFSKAISLMGLSKDWDINYSNKDLPGVPFYIIRKGDGYFPEKFESRILSRRVLSNAGVFVPDSEDMLWAALYDISVHGRKQTKHHARVILGGVKARVGIAPCSYQSVFTRGENA